MGFVEERFPGSLAEGIKISNEVLKLYHCILKGAKVAGSYQVLLAQDHLHTAESKCI